MRILMFCLMLFVLAGCLSVNPVDEASLDHARQGARIVEGINNGMDDAAIDGAIEEAWRIARAVPDSDDVDTESEQYVRFARKCREWAVSDVEREIDADQARAWIEYEESKQEEAEEEDEGD